MDFRPFTTKDPEYQSSLDLRNKHLRVPLGLTLSEEDIAGESEQFHFGFFEDTRALASVTMKKIGPNRIKLRQMVVDPSLQGSGIGRRLIANAEQVLKAMGFTNITMAARRQVANFYQKLGYKSIGTPFTEVGIDHITMEKSLD